MHRVESKVLMKGNGLQINLETGNQQLDSNSASMGYASSSSYHSVSSGGK